MTVKDLRQFIFKNYYYKQIAFTKKIAIIY